MVFNGNYGAKLDPPPTGTPVQLVDLVVHPRDVANGP